MRTPILLPRRGDVLGILLALVVTAIFIAVFVLLPRRPGDGSGSNFGPDWDCQSVPKGGPVCIKRVQRTAPK